MTEKQIVVVIGATLYYVDRATGICRKNPSYIKIDKVSLDKIEFYLKSHNMLKQHSGCKTDQNFWSYKDRTPHTTIDLTTNG